MSAHVARAKALSSRDRSQYPCPMRRVFLAALLLASSCATNGSKKPPTNPPTTQPYYVNYMPFGAGQFQNGEPVKGAVFAVTECAAVTTSAALWLYLSTAYPGDLVPIGHAERVQTLERVEMATGAAFFAAYAIGVADALLHYRARTRLAPSVVGGSPGLVWSWSE